LHLFIHLLAASSCQKPWRAPSSSDQANEKHRVTVGAISQSTKDGKWH
jgi:hypothetical protein